MKYSQLWLRLTKADKEHMHTHILIPTGTCVCVCPSCICAVCASSTFPSCQTCPWEITAQLTAIQSQHFLWYERFLKKKIKIIHATFCLIWKKKVSHLLCVTSEPQRHEINSYGWWKVKDTLDFHQIRGWAATLCKIKSTFLILSFHGSPQLNI